MPNCTLLRGLGIYASRGQCGGRGPCKGKMQNYRTLELDIVLNIILFMDKELSLREKVVLKQMD